MKQMALDIQLGEGATLDNFVQGDNVQLLQHLRLLVQAPQPSTVPTYLWGAHGVGKSHLLRAVRALAMERSERVGWLDASLTATQGFDTAWRWIILDDVQRFDTLHQHLAFNWLVHAINPPAGLKHTVLACGDVPPADLKLRDDLRSRLGWGHVFEVRGLSDQAMSEVLKRQAQTMGLNLGDEVVDYILARFSRNLTSLHQLLRQLDAYALEKQRSVTVPLLRRMFEDLS